MRSFSYNLANQLTAAGSATITYDPLGRLAQVAASSTTQYLYDGAMLVAEYDTSGTMLRRYVPGAGVDETLIWYEGSDLSAPHWLHTDNQGSVIATTDASAAATPFAYSVTGEPKGGWSSSPPAFRYTGQVAIASAQIYFYKARMYDPALGRFLQTDPVGYAAGMNLYAYVGNDPANGLDPTGLCPDGVTECVTVSADRPPFSWEWNAWDKISSFIESIPTILPRIPPPNNTGSPSQGNDTNGGNKNPGHYDGVCRMADGSLHPYNDIGGGYIDVFPGNGLNALGVGIGAAGNSTATPTLAKPGGIAGGGASGPVTSPASSAARGLTCNARFGALRPFTGTGSIGGSIGRAIPFLGTTLMFFNFMQLSNAPVCTPVANTGTVY